MPKKVLKYVPHYVLVLLIQAVIKVAYTYVLCGRVFVIAYIYLSVLVSHIVLFMLLNTVYPPNGQKKSH